MTAIEPDNGERKAMSEETTMRDGEERDREEKCERETERASTEHASPKDGGGAPGSAEPDAADAPGAGAAHPDEAEPEKAHSDEAEPGETGPNEAEPDEAVGSTIPDPDRKSLEAFWVRARNLCHIAPLEAVLGQDDVSSLCPPAFSFGDTPELADRLAKLVLDGEKTATSGWRASYEAEGIDLPERGDLAIMCDGRGEPLALLRNSEVRVIGFQEADSEISDAEGEGPFESWKAAHEDFFAQECQDLGIDYDPDGDIVVEFFDVLHSRADERKGRRSAAKRAHPEAREDASETHEDARAAQGEAAEGEAPEAPAEDAAEGGKPTKSGEAATPGQTDEE